MDPAIESVLQAALVLPAGSRAIVVERLIESLDEDLPAEDEDVDEAWQVEIARRVKAIEDGTAETIEMDEAFRRLAEEFPD